MGAPQKSRRQHQGRCSEWIGTYWILLLLAFTVFVGRGQDEQSHQRGIDRDSLRVAVDHAAQHASRHPDWAPGLQDGNLNILYEVAQDMYTDAHKQPVAILLLHNLADGNAQHLLSQVALGQHYYQTDPPHLEQALTYFSQAGAAGPHQAALYNAGRIYAELGQVEQALAYMQAAASVATTHPKLARDKLTNTARQAGEQLTAHVAETGRRQRQTSPDEMQSEL